MLCDLSLQMFLPFAVLILLELQRTKSLLLAPSPSLQAICVITLKSVSIYFDMCQKLYFQTVPALFCNKGKA